MRGEREQPPPPGPLPAATPTTHPNHSGPIQQRPSSPRTECGEVVDLLYAGSPEERSSSTRGDKSFERREAPASKILAEDGDATTQPRRAQEKESKDKGIDQVSAKARKDSSGNVRASYRDVLVRPGTFKP